MNQKFKGIVSTLILIVVLSSCQSSPLLVDSCAPEVRAAFDIGSGSTKMKVAKVDPCAEEILEVLSTSARKVDYAESLARTELFTEEVRAAGLVTLQELREEASRFRPKRWRAVATAAFRKAKNAESFLKEVEKKIGLKARVISQEEEGKLGFQAAVGRNDNSRTLVWDIGGGSQQFSYLASGLKSGLDSGEKLNVFLGKMGAVVFKNLVIEKVKKQDPQKVNSPNPLVKKFGNAEKLAMDGASDLSSELKKWIGVNRPKVIGVGGVHYHSVLKQLGVTDQYEKAAVKKAARERAFWNDKKIGGKYASTEVTNLILVASFMEALGIDVVKVKNVDLTDALLVVKD